MSSRREDVLSAFFAQFSGLSRYETKARMPNWIIEYSKLPALIQLDGGADFLGGTQDAAGIGPLMRLDLRVTVIAGIRAGDPDNIGSELSEARAEILETAAVDPVLGGLCDSVLYDGEEDPEMLIEAGRAPHALFPIYFSIRYTEEWNDPRS